MAALVGAERAQAQGYRLRLMPLASTAHSGRRVRHVRSSGSAIGEHRVQQFALLRAIVVGRMITLSAASHLENKYGRAGRVSVVSLALCYGFILRSGRL